MHRVLLWVTGNSLSPLRWPPPKVPAIIAAMGTPRIRIDIWSDYACPHCHRVLAVVEALRREMGDALDVEWHAFELEAGATCAAFEAVEFARDHDRFDAMHAALFRARHEERRDIADGNVLQAVARSVGLDGAALAAALASSRYTPRVVGDESRAASLGLESVPFFAVRRDGAPITAALGISGAAALEDVRAVVAKVTSS